MCLEKQTSVNCLSLPEKQVLLCGDGHTWITLDYTENSNPSVRRIDVESNENILVVISFDKFLEGLVSGKIYNVN